MFIADVESVPAEVMPAGSKLYPFVSDATTHSKYHSITFFEFVPGGCCQRHSHPDNFEESYFILEGKAEVHIGDDVHVLGANQCVYIPPGTVHDLVNIGENTLKFLAITTPPWTPDSYILAD